MNTSWLVGIPIAAMVGIGTLEAADFPRKAPPLIAPAWNWTGLYGGLHSGLGFGKAEFSNPYTDFGNTIYGNDVPTPAALLGGQLGYNYQLGNWVAGLEADTSWLSSDGTNTCFAVSGLFLSSTCHVKPNFLGTLTGRFGIAVGPAGRTLLYGKGGLAVIQENVIITRNNGRPEGKDGTPLFSTGLDVGSTSTRAGWIVGTGVEQAVTPAWSWKLEYDYQRFSGASVATPQTANLLSFDPNGTTSSALVSGRIAAIQQDFHSFKLGVNYKLGGDPWATWDLPASPRLYPVKAKALAAPMGWVPGWEFETGVRYWYSIGRSRVNLGDFQSIPDPIDTLVSRLTYENLRTHTGEFFARIDSPYRVFAKGFVGGGAISSGNMRDEDWLPFSNTVSGIKPPPSGVYSNTDSPLVTGNATYGTIDVGYDWLRGPTFKSGVFVGYNHFYEKMKAFGCVQTAGPFVCSGGNDPHRPTTILSITATARWDSLRVGAGGEILIGPVRLSAEAAYLPYVRFRGEDNHFDPTGAILKVAPESGDGRGVQFEAFATYNVTANFSVGVGGRYWAMWTTSGQAHLTCCNEDTGLPETMPPQRFKFATEQAGLLFQASYKLGATAHEPD